MSDFNLQKYFYLLTQKSFEDGMELYGKNNDTIDKIIVWLVGFSITIIILLITNVDSKILIDTTSRAWIMFFAFLTILFGILQRILMVFINKVQIDIKLTFDQHVAGYLIPEDNKYSRFISEYDNSVEDVINYLKLDFDFIYNGVIPEKNSKEYITLLKALIAKHSELQDNLLLFEANLFAESLSKQIGYKIPKITTLENQNKTYNYNVFKLLNFSNLMFYFTCASFLAIILIAVISYLITTA